MPTQTFPPSPATSATTRHPRLDVSMLLHPWFFIQVQVLLLLSVLFTTYLYLYPAFHGCSFPGPSPSHTKEQQHGEVDGKVERARKAPFRLLAFGDPQLEGDTSLPPAHEFESPARLRSVVSNLRERRFRDALDSSRSLLRVGFEDSAGYMSYVLGYARKRLDLLGNDFYLAHVYRALHWWTAPTHVAVLGDLLGSQWIDDDEFERRSARYWNRVFRGGKKVPADLLSAKETENYAPRTEVLGADPEWSRRIINIAGNHDIGYAGDVDEERIDRFEREFGPVNGDVVFRLSRSGVEDNADDGHPPAIRVIVLNSMNLDTPAKSASLQGATYTFLNDVIIASEPVESHNTTTILLTHIPLHKESGVCFDDPFFSFFAGFPSDGVKEQNFISSELSRDAILQGVFGKSPSVDASARGMGRDGIVLTGHDHEGCDIYHSANRSAGQWEAQSWPEANASGLLNDTDVPGLREVTVRSMMGEFGGNAALLAAWWVEAEGRWAIEVGNCGFGIQHVWWTIHVLDLVTIFVSIIAGLAYMFGGNSKASREAPGKVKTGVGKSNAGLNRKSVKQNGNVVAKTTQKT